MLITLATGEVFSQAKSSLLANGHGEGDPQPWAMSKYEKKKSDRPARRLYIGQWLARLNRKPADMARALGLTESYVSELISGRKKGPTPEVLLGISEWLELTVNDLYLPPPENTALDAIEHLNPAQMATLARLLDDLKRSGRK